MECSNTGGPQITIKSSSSYGGLIKLFLISWGSTYEYPTPSVHPNGGLSSFTYIRKWSGNSSRTRFDSVLSYTPNHVRLLRQKWNSGREEGLWIHSFSRGRSRREWSGSWGRCPCRLLIILSSLLSCHNRGWNRRRIEGGVLPLRTCTWYFQVECNWELWWWGRLFRRLCIECLWHLHHRAL